MKKLSAGILVYRIKGSNIEVLIAHMGSPWWAKKDKGAWSIPKGEHTEDEPALVAAKREFKEELGLEAPAGEFIDLGTIDQKNKKIVQAWAVEGDIDASQTHSNTFTLEWPPRSGKMQEFPEIDRTAWYGLEQAAAKLIPEQAELLQRLAYKLGQEIDVGEEQTEPNQQTLL